MSITDRVESEGEHFYKVNWKDGDSTWEPISNLGKFYELDKKLNFEFVVYQNGGEGDIQFYDYFI